MSTHIVGENLARRNEIDRPLGQGMPKPEDRARLTRAAAASIIRPTKELCSALEGDAANLRLRISLRFML